MARKMPNAKRSERSARQFRRTKEGTRRGKNIEKNSAFENIRALARQIVELQDRARKLGVFANDRELLCCYRCGLEEDVAFEGTLMATKPSDRFTDTGLRFELDHKTRHARCPGCGTRFKLDDENETVPDAKRLSGPAMKAFLRIAGRWGLSEEQKRNLLGILDQSEYTRWKSGRGGPLPTYILKRISHLQAIFSSLHVLLPNAKAANAWVKKLNAAPLFGGQPALMRLLSRDIANILAVRQYLEAQKSMTGANVRLRGKAKSNLRQAYDMTRDRLR